MDGCADGMEVTSVGHLGWWPLVGGVLEVAEAEHRVCDGVSLGQFRTVMDGRIALRVKNCARLWCCGSAGIWVRTYWMSYKGVDCTW